MTFYEYFLLRWNDPAIPEFDFETGELVYRDGDREYDQEGNLRVDPGFGTGRT